MMEEQDVKTLITEIREENSAERSYLQKQLNMMRVLMVVMAGILVLMLITVVVLVPRISSTLNNANTAIEDISATAQQAQEILSAVDTLVAESEEGISTAVDALNAIDFEGLNQSIEDLGNVVSPFADFFAKFK
jgi:predicted PurR-regulated permease PerM